MRSTCDDDERADLHQRRKNSIRAGYARFLAERDHDEERRDRALLWILALPQLLWRKPWYSKATCESKLWDVFHL